MECSSQQRGVSLEDVMSLLKAKFDAEREYHHADLHTASEEVASKEEEILDD